MDMDFSGSQWIRTNETGPARPDGPPPLAGRRPFRRLIPNPQGVTPVHAKILITADFSYTLYVNGNKEGEGDKPAIAPPYCVSLDSKCGTLIAVEAVNVQLVPEPPKVLAKIEIMYDDGTTSVVVSDSAWKALNKPDKPYDYTNFSFDDSSWPNAVISPDPPPKGISPSNVTCKCPKPCKCTSSSCGCGCNY